MKIFEKWRHYDRGRVHTGCSESVSKGNKKAKYVSDLQQLKEKG